MTNVFPSPSNVPVRAPQPVERIEFTLYMPEVCDSYQTTSRRDGNVLRVNVEPLINENQNTNNFIWTGRSAGSLRVQVNPLLVIEAPMFWNRIHGSWCEFHYRNNLRPGLNFHLIRIYLGPSLHKVRSRPNWELRVQNLIRSAYHTYGRALDIIFMNSNRHYSHFPSLNETNTELLTYNSSYLFANVVFQLDLYH